MGERGGKQVGGERSGFIFQAGNGNPDDGGEGMFFFQILPPLALGFGWRVDPFDDHPQQPVAEQEGNVEFRKPWRIGRARVRQQNMGMGQGKPSRKDPVGVIEHIVVRVGGLQLSSMLFRLLLHELKIGNQKDPQGSGKRRCPRQYPVTAKVEDIRRGGNFHHLDRGKIDPSRTVETQGRRRRGNDRETVGQHERHIRRHRVQGLGHRRRVRHHAVDQQGLRVVFGQEVVVHRHGG